MKTPAAKLEQNRAWKINHREHLRAYNQTRYAANRIAELARATAWKKKNPERRLAAERQRLYGITPDMFAAMMLEQSGLCAICARSFGAPGPQVDHDHVAGDVRALLCKDCNLGLGRFADNPIRLAAAIAYLASHKLKLAIA